MFNESNMAKKEELDSQVIGGDGREGRVGGKSLVTNPQNLPTHETMVERFCRFVTKQKC